MVPGVKEESEVEMMVGGKPKLKPRSRVQSAQFRQIHSVLLKPQHPHLSSIPARLYKPLGPVSTLVPSPCSNCVFGLDESHHSASRGSRLIVTQAHNMGLTWCIDLKLDLPMGATFISCMPIVCLKPRSRASCKGLLTMIQVQAILRSLLTSLISCVQKVLIGRRKLSANYHPFFFSSLWALTTVLNFLTSLCPSPAPFLASVVVSNWAVLPAALTF